jgi:imidazolonepropionase-like amidohydrolase
LEEAPVRTSSVVVSLTLLASAGMLPTRGAGQSVSSLSEKTRALVSVAEPVVALANATIIDGTGAAPKTGQTIIVRDGKIDAVGAAATVQVPAGARVLDLKGQTVIPGIIGMHDHLFYTAAGGRRTLLSFTGPRLYLAAGVTTIRTTGAMAPYADINTKHAIDAGQAPGPHVIITTPYITGPTEGTYMTVRERLSSPEQSRRFVDYWAAEGASWVKAYTDIRRAELKAVIDEAHLRGMKVTGHLCSVSYTEAVDLGIDNLEHGFMTATDFDPGKQPDVCPVNATTTVGNSNPNSDVGHAVIKKMIDHKVPMTSTLSVFESMFPGRPVTDQRTLDAMAPEVRQAYVTLRAHIDSGAAVKWALTVDMLKHAMAFEREFVDAGGLLAVGVDPTGIGGALPGYGDQRNYELLIEAGFTPQQVVQFMTSNGAKILGASNRIGSIEAGKSADLVVLNGDLASDPSVIRKVTTVFKDGVGYDSPKLIATVAGRVGID